MFDHVITLTVSFIIEACTYYMARAGLALLPTTPAKCTGEAEMGGVVLPASAPLLPYAQMRSLMAQWSEVVTAMGDGSGMAGEGSHPTTICGVAAHGDAPASSGPT
jgi:hypothetical protein